MTVKMELLQNYMNECAKVAVELCCGKMGEIADTMALAALSEIKDIICNEALSDFEAVEEIVCVLEKHNIDCGSRHDF